MELTHRQREEVGHLHGIAQYEADDQQDADWQEIAEALQAVLDGTPTPYQLNAAIGEIEYHADKFAPARATKFRPADRGDPALFASLNALLRKLRACQLDSDVSEAL